MHIQLKHLIAGLLLAATLPALAVDEHHPDQPAATASATPSEQSMTEQIYKMQAIHDRIAAAKTPAERQAAMREGMEAMKEGMAMMQRGCPMGGMGMDGKGMGGKWQGGGMGMMDMMMKMMDQQSHMMDMHKQP